MFVRRGWRWLPSGIVAGLAAAAALTQAMASVLFGVDPLDPVTFAAVPLVLLDGRTRRELRRRARRVAAISPVEALKAE